MRVPSHPIALAGAVLALAAGPAAASTCYVVLDARDTAVYRNTMSPVDLSEQGKAARDALRQRGNYLLIIETDRCVPIGSAVGQAGSSAATLADYVSGVPSVITTNAAAAAAARPATGGAASTAPAAPAPARRQPSRGY